MDTVEKWSGGPRQPVVHIFLEDDFMSLKLVPLAADADRHHWVPLDFAAVVPEHTRFENVRIRIEDLPFGAALSKGRTDGDHRWSVPSVDLEGLCYVPAKPDFAPHRLCVRVVGTNEDEAVVLDQFDIEVRSPGTPPKILGAAVSGDGDVLIRFEDEKTNAMRRAAAAETGRLLRHNDKNERPDDMPALMQRLKDVEHQIAELSSIAANTLRRLAADEGQGLDVAEREILRLHTTSSAA